METFFSTNPATDEIMAHYAAMSDATAAEYVDLAAEAQKSWAARSFAERGDCLRKAGAILLDRKDELARLAAREMGKPVGQGRGEVAKCAVVCDYYAENAEAFLTPESMDAPSGRAYTSFHPLGVILLVMPWNFPFWQVFRMAVPVLMAGNAVVLKHASNVQGCAAAIQEVLNDCDLPRGLFANLPVTGSQVAKVLEHPAVQGVSLTGSEGAGRAVAAKAGQMLKRSLLELGGSDPFIVLEDADLDKAVAVGVQSRCQNTGQSCIAAKRFIVMESVYDAFLQALKSSMSALQMGDPLEEGIALGPLARVDLREELHAQVNASVGAGARLVLGGEVPQGKGAFYPPTILADVTEDHPAWSEELFGPVATVIRARDVEHAIAIANSSPFGLGGSVWSRDIAKAEAVAARVESGTMTINRMVSSDARLPFGGIKNSGYGRELGLYGIREFVNVQTVWIDEE